MLWVQPWVNKCTDLQKEYNSMGESLTSCTVRCHWGNICNYFLYKAINRPLIAFSSQWGLFSIALIMDLNGTSQWTSIILTISLVIRAWFNPFFLFCTKYKYNTTSAFSCCKIDKKQFYTRYSTVMSFTLKTGWQINSSAHIMCV